MADRVRALKIERPSGGGGQRDRRPRSLNPNEDHLDARGLILQNNSSADEDVAITRDALGQLVFTDAVVAGSRTLTDLLGGAASSAIAMGRVTLTVAPDDDELEGEVAGLGSVARVVCNGFLSGDDDDATQDLASFRMIILNTTSDGFCWRGFMLGDDETKGGDSDTTAYFDYIYTL